MTTPPWETAIGALDVFEKKVRQYHYDLPGLQQQRLDDIASAKTWVRNHRDTEGEK